MGAGHRGRLGALRRELEDNGGYCDCEVMLNVFGGDFDAADVCPTPVTN
jgi:hypothetical protein